MAERTANELAYDETVRRKVQILRFAEGEADKAAELLAAIEQDLLDKIAGALARSDLTRARLEELLASVKELQAQAFGRVAEEVQADLDAFAADEASWEKSMLERVSPVELQLATVAASVVRAAARSPFQGLKLTGWLDGIEAHTVAQIERAIVLGKAQGETIDQIVGRVRGTKSAAYQDGLLQVQARDARAVVRTAVNHVSNEAREVVWGDNADLILCLRWTSTLDGRTTDICRARDGQVAPVDGSAPLEDDALGPRLDPPGARPPAHFNCRSVMVPVISAAGILGMRPSVRDSRTREKREAAFRHEAKERGVPIQQVRAEWAQRVVGRVPAKTTYDEWLRLQPATFQDDVLGPERAKLFRDGMTLDRFVDFNGRRFTLDELRGGR